ncbi:expressed unknown protein [Seminavis robusta]|uniref:Uncharacterized protein n=1 Tax=Seminavis robusta TaxID=568900 RepID=A0A9N8EYP6_9STRA|nr:expressed unknown protein [Seminavis robusta]|eukprot:Sro2319_g323140.1 n/a (90) ;mRNA; f:12448-12814
MDCSVRRSKNILVVSHRCSNHPGLPLQIVGDFGGWLVVGMCHSQVLTLHERPPPSGDAASWLCHRVSSQIVVENVGCRLFVCSLRSKPV